MIEIGLLLLGIVIGYVTHRLMSQKIIVENKFLTDKLNFQEAYQQQLSETLELRFKNLSNSIFEEKSKKFREDSIRGMELMLNPLKDKVSDFQKKIEEIHLHELRDRLKLHAELEQVMLLGQKMSNETHNLTRALKGSNKMQGHWGEFILERLLEASGLKSGEDYTSQGKDLGLRNDEGKIQLPDVIINLPEDRHLIVDSKVSLISYERFINEESEQDLSAFLDSLYAHIKDLSNKRYHLSQKLVSPDYVLMFIPIEGAYILAMQKDQEIFNFAWSKNVVLAGPSTLLATMKTVASLWRQEKQNKNAMEIARQAGLLFDKFVGITQDLDQIDQQMKRTQGSFDQLRIKLMSGRGSLAARMENLKDLGAKNSKDFTLDH